VNAVDQAAAELYAGDPDTFTERRRELAASARTQGDAAAAKQIAALRKPTRGAWTLNALARGEPGLVAQLVELGGQLRGAEQRLDGAAMRELSRRRRELVDDATRRAFAATSQDAPSAALRDEVNATLLAAVADPEVAEQLAAGRLVRAAQWDGFGAAGAPTTRPDLAVVSPPGPAAPTRSGAKATRATAEPISTTSREPTAAERARREPTAAERARRERVAAAEKEVAAARRQLAKAETEAARHRDRLGSLEEQLAAARQRLTDAGHQVREARADLRRAEQRLARARG